MKSCKKRSAAVAVIIALAVCLAGCDLPPEYAALQEACEKAAYIAETPVAAPAAEPREEPAQAAEEPAPVEQPVPARPEKEPQNEPARQAAAEYMQEPEKVKEPVKAQEPVKAEEPKESKEPKTPTETEPPVQAEIAAESTPLCGGEQANASCLAEELLKRIFDQKTSGALAESSAAQPAPETPAAEDETEAEEMLRLMNEARAAAGVAPLALDTGHDPCAQVRANEIRQVFSHTRPNGQSAVTVLDEQGFSRPRAFGENIQMYSAGSVQTAHENFMNSAGHRANILHSAFSRVSICFLHTDRGTYLVQLFFG